MVLVVDWVYCPIGAPNGKGYLCLGFYLLETMKLHQLTNYQQTISWFRSCLRLHTMSPRIFGRLRGFLQSQNCRKFQWIWRCVNFFSDGWMEFTRFFTNWTFIPGWFVDSGARITRQYPGHGVVLLTRCYPRVKNLSLFKSEMRGYGIPVPPYFKAFNAWHHFWCLYTKPLW